MIHEDTRRGTKEPLRREMIHEDARRGTKKIKPFLKWAGGKTQLLEQYAPLFPREFNGYHEPFVGSAAVYLRLCGLSAADPLRSPLNRVRLTDSNDELINAYRAVRDQPHSLMALLAEHKRLHDQAHYYQVRAQKPNALSPIERAARLIYLNKTCFNGLYRVNRAGQFNVPMGRYQNPGLFDAEDLQRVSRALQRVELEVMDFRSVVQHARRGDFVYFDPPYLPVTRTAHFTRYTDQPFGEAQQCELAEVFRALDRQGCCVMLSNSWTPFILELYRDFNCIEVKAARAINSKAAGRGRVSEVVVVNYDVGDIEMRQTG